MKTITITDEQYNKLCDVLEDYCDCGPQGYGWRSEELESLITSINGDCQCGKDDCEDCSYDF